MTTSKLPMMDGTQATPLPAEAGNSASDRVEVMVTLKHETRHIHKRLDTELNMLDIVATASGYAAVIGMFRALFLRYEEQLLTFESAFGERGLDISSRLKLHLLDEDLREIESRFHIQPSAIDGDPELEHIVMQSLSSAVGWLYVLEGSTLGGMMISRRIRDTLGVPTHYYVSDVSLTMPKWRAFGAWVNAQANEPWFVLAEACTAAVTAFEIVYGLMERNVTGTARPIN